MSARSASKEAIKARKAVFDLIDKYKVELPDQLKFPPPGFAGSAKHQEVVFSFMEKVAMLLAPMDRDRSEFSLREGSRSMVRSFEHLQDRLPQTLASPGHSEPLQLACKAGCNHCCTFRVSVMAPEALALAHYLKKKLDQAQLEALQERIASFELETAKLSPIQQVTRVALCPLNVEGKCMGYANRPSACIAYHSFDLSKCIERREKPETESQVVQDSLRLTLRSLHQQATHAAMSALNLDETELEFIPALKVALTDPEAGAKYLKGKPVFATADMPEVRDAYKKHHAESKSG